MPRSNRNKWSSPLPLDSKSSGEDTQQVVTDDIFLAVQEMFEDKLDPEVIHMVLVECGWEVERALECLFNMCDDSEVKKIKTSKLRQIAEDILISSPSNSVMSGDSQEVPDRVFGTTDTQREDSVTHSKSESSLEYRQTASRTETRNSQSIFKTFPTLSSDRDLKEDNELISEFQCNIVKNVGAIGDKRDKHQDSTHSSFNMQEHTSELSVPLGELFGSNQYGSYFHQSLSDRDNISCLPGENNNSCSSDSSQLSNVKVRSNYTAAGFCDDIDDEIVIVKSAVNKENKPPDVSRLRRYLTAGDSLQEDLVSRTVSCKYAGYSDNNKQLQSDLDEDAEVCAIQNNSKVLKDQKWIHGRITSPSTSSPIVSSADHSINNTLDNSYTNHDRLQSDDLNASFSCGLSAVISSPVHSLQNLKTDSNILDKNHPLPSVYNSNFKYHTSHNESHLTDGQLTVGFGAQTLENSDKYSKIRNRKSNDSLDLECLKILDLDSDDESNDSMANSLTNALKQSLNITESKKENSLSYPKYSDSDGSSSSPEKLADKMTAALKKSLGITSPEVEEKEQNLPAWNVLGLVNDSTWTPSRHSNDAEDDDDEFKEKMLKESESLKCSNDDISDTNISMTKSSLSADAPEFIPNFPPLPSRNASRISPSSPMFLTPKYTSPKGKSTNIAYVKSPSPNELSKLPFSPPLPGHASSMYPAVIPVVPVGHMIPRPVNYSAVVSRNPVIPAREMIRPPLPPPPPSPPENEEIRKVREKIASGQLCMVVLRGLPGSGKSTLARHLQGYGASLSTDDYFVHNGVYRFDPQKLQTAHDRNRLRTIEELKKKTNPVIIDNTNTQAWEMKPYIKLALKFRYEPLILEPDTPWKFKVKELARRNTHSVPLETIQRMLERYQSCLTVQIIIGKSWLDTAQGRQVPVLNKNNNASTETTSEDWEVDEDLKKETEVKKDNSVDVKPPEVCKGEDLGSDTDMSKLVESHGDSDSDTDMTKMAGIHDDWGVSTGLFDEDWQTNLQAQARSGNLDISWEIETSSKWKRQLTRSSQSPSLSETGSSVSAATGGTESDRDRMFSQERGYLSDTEKETCKTRRSETLLSEDEKSGSSYSLPSLLENEEVENMESIPEYRHPKSMSSNSLTPVKIGDKMSKLDTSPSSGSTEYQTCSDIPTDQEDEQKLSVKQSNDYQYNHSVLIGKESSDNKSFEYSQNSNDSDPGGKESFDLSNLDVELREQVEGLIRENVGDEVNQDYRTTAEELKAYLMFMSLESEQQALAEKLIERRLIHKIPSYQDKFDIPGSPHVKTENKRAPADGGINIKQTDNSIIDSTLNLDDWEDPKLQRNEISRSRRKRNSSKINENRQVDSETSVADGENSTGLKIEDKSYVSWEDPQPQRDKRYVDSKQGNIITDLQEEDSSIPQALAYLFDAAKNEDQTTITPDEVKSPVNISSVDSSPIREIALKTKRKKKSSRKKPNSGFVGPFLDDSTKEQFLNSSWTLPEISPSSSSSVSPVKAMPSRRFSKLTEITPADLKALDRINKGHEDVNLSEYKVLTGIVHVIDREASVESTETDGSSEACNLLDDAIIFAMPLKQFVDRSTMTEEIFDVGLDFLVNSFPSIPENELSDTLQQCDNDVEWATSLLLDWKYHLPLSTDDKQKFVDNMFKVQNMPKSTTIPKTATSKSQVTVSSPLSLLDMCVNFIEQQNISERREIEQQMIMSSQQRLNSMEENIRFRRLGSVGGEQRDIEEEFDSDLILRELQSKSSEDNSFDGSELNCISNGPSDSLEEDMVVLPDQSSENKERSEVRDAVKSSSPREAVMALPIPRDIAKALVALFGPVSADRDILDNIQIPLDYRTAEALHHCWQKAKKSQVLNTARQLEEDEAFARRLQEEENSGTTSSDKHLMTGRIRVPSMGGHFRRANITSLKDIMKEEMAKEQKKEQEQQVLMASGNHQVLANRLKKQRLYEQFPGIDENLLDDLFTANSYNLDNTILAIHNFLSRDPSPPQTVMTTEAAEAYETKLIEAAKQQSLQEMLDSYLHAPQVARDNYQTEDAPGYEDYRAEANIHHRLRHECFHKAQEAYRRGMKQVAAFYSEQGHLHTQKIKEANMRASERILEERNISLQEKSTLDLHGLHVDEAIAALNTFIPQKEIDYQQKPDKRKQHLIIITGRGNHSKGGVPKIRPAVLLYLKNHKYKYREVHTGFFKVLLKYRTE